MYENSFEILWCNKQYKILSNFVDFNAEVFEVGKITETTKIIISYVISSSFVLEWIDLRLLVLYRKLLNEVLVNYSEASVV